MVTALLGGGDVGMALTLAGAVILTGLWIWGCWWLPLQRLKDPSVKNKGLYRFLLALGILPLALAVLIILVAGIDAWRRHRPAPGGVSAAAGTNVGPTVNAPPGPQPVLSNANRAALRAFAPRNPQPY